MFIFYFYQPVIPHTNSTKIGSAAKLKSLSTSLLQLNVAQKTTYYEMKKAKQVSSQSKKRKVASRKAAKKARRYVQGRSQNAEIIIRTKWSILKRVELSLVTFLYKLGLLLKESIRSRKQHFFPLSSRLWC